jgi:tRNA threonylcarbamoyladenosine biosynthesis protein TsaE
MLFRTTCAEQTEIIGERLARALHKNKKRAFIAMRGEMGVGKTAFTRGFARALGISGVKSPTYTVVNEHRGEARLFHYDMYRIEDEDDLYSTGFDDYLASDGYIVAEWSEKIPDLIPEDAIFVTVRRSAEGEEIREIEIGFPDRGYENVYSCI